MTLTDVTTLKGKLSFRVIRNGDVIRAETVNNLIVNKGRHNLAVLLGGQSGMHVSAIAVGEGSTEAALTDTALTEPVLTPISETRVGTNLENESGGSFDDEKIVQFHFRIPRTTAVNKSICEYGLMCADDTLFSRIVRPSPFVKTEIDMIIGFWQISF